MKSKAMVVAGVMSGTSADGVDVALVRISAGAVGVPKLKVLGHSEFPYVKKLREAVLRAAAGEMQVAELSRLSWRLGEVYAGCVEEACAAAGLRFGLKRSERSRWDGESRGSFDSVRLPPISAQDDRSVRGPGMLGLVGVHGQTVFHEGRVATLQIGEAAVVAERLRVPVVSDFRSADLAAGGQGAPLVPMLDWVLSRSRTRNRVMLNLGGIANMTAVPAGAGLEDVIAFDSGPANMVIDALMKNVYGREFDSGGATGARGRAVASVVEDLMREPYFSAEAPKSCGREQFGVRFAERVYALCVAAGAKKPDVIATAAELTVRSVYEGYARTVWPHLGVKAPLARGTDLIVAGGGTRNGLVMRRLGEMFEGLGVKVKVSDEVGLPSQSKEAVAFALLAWLSRHGRVGNVPSATGARRGVVLGRVTC